MNENFNSLPREERPYERCMLHGAGRLSDRELLAVLLRTGSKGRTVLELAGDLLHLVPERQGFTGLRRMTIEELSSVKGIGSVKAVQLKCVLELARRMAREQGFILKHRLLWQNIIWKICATGNRKCSCF